MKHVRFDEFVRGHLKGAADEPLTPECLDPMAVLALLHRPEDVRKEDVQHLLTCRRCQWLVNVAHRDRIPVPSPRSIPQRLFGSIPRFVGTVAVAAAALVLVALPLLKKPSPVIPVVDVGGSFDRSTVFDTFRSADPPRHETDPFFIGVSAVSAAVIHIVAVLHDGSTEAVVDEDVMQYRTLAAGQTHVFGPLDVKRGAVDTFLVVAADRDVIDAFKAAQTLHVDPGPLRKSIERLKRDWESRLRCAVHIIRVPLNPNHR